MLFNEHDIKNTQDKASDVCKAGKEYIAENAEEVMWLICNMNQLIGVLHLEIKGEKEYREWVKKHSFKGYVSGYPTRVLGPNMVARQHDQLYEQEKIALRKLANNPILSGDVKKVLRRAEWMLNLALWDHNQVVRCQEKKRKEEQKKKGYFISGEE